MSASVLTDVQLLVNAMELGPFTGEFSDDVMAAMREAPNFAAKGYGVKLPGLTSARFGIKGYADYASGAINQSFASAQAGQQVAWSILPTGSAAVAGDPALFTRVRLDAMKMLGGNTGDVAVLELSGVSDSAAVDGFVGAPLAARTTTLTGSAVALPGPTATQRLWAALHVTEATGTNLVVKVQSDDNGSFTSATDRITFSTVSAVDWQFLSVAGSFSSETHHRVTASMSTSGFTFACVFGVL
jgi:hypothetical protein